MFVGSGVSVGGSAVGLGSGVAAAVQAAVKKANKLRMKARGLDMRVSSMFGEGGYQDYSHFFNCQKGEGYIFILGFNMVPLSSLLLQALVNHPKLAPETTPIQWTAEQEIVVEGELREVKDILLCDLSR